jgi:hypothetical protein
MLWITKCKLQYNEIFFSFNEIFRSVESAVQLLTLAIKLPNVIAFNDLVMSPTVQQVSDIISILPFD